MAIMLRHVTEPLPPAAEVADVDPAISAWIERLVAKKPEDRPQSATAAWEDLEEILIGELGPRWRREAPLPCSSTRRSPGRHTPPPSQPMTTPPGIDMEGTGPDTGEPMPAAEAPEEPAYETYHPPPTGPTPKTSRHRRSRPRQPRRHRQPRRPRRLRPHRRLPSRRRPRPRRPLPRRPRPLRSRPRRRRRSCRARPRRRRDRRPPEPAARPRVPRQTRPPRARRCALGGRRAPRSPCSPKAPTAGTCSRSCRRSRRSAWRSRRGSSRGRWPPLASTPRSPRAGCSASAPWRSSPRWRCCASRPTGSTGSRRCSRSSSCSARSRRSPPASAACAPRRPNRRRRPSTRARSCSGSPASGSPGWRCSSTTTASARCGSSWSGERERGVLLRAGGRRRRPRSPGSACSARGRGSPAGCCSRSARVAALHYVGLLVAAARAIGEVGDTRAAGYIGVLGGLLILAAGALASRAKP